MKRLLFVLLIVLLVATSAYASEQKLTSAYEQELIQRVEGVFGSEGQKEKLKEPARPICATPIFVELFNNYDGFSPEAKKLLSSLIDPRPDYSWTDPKTYDTPSGHFKIHYVISGEDAVFEPDIDTLPADGHPDYVNRCAEIMDYVWHHEIDTLGYNSPPPDDWYTPNGGDGKYDVYLVDLELGYLGFTKPEYYSAYPKATSYIVLRSDYSIFTKPPYNMYDDQYDPMKVTAAHEFFHSIQMGYDATEYGGSSPDYKPYWMEMTAVWMEDKVYDDINDYLGYIFYFFYYPWLSLKTFSYNDLDKPKYYHAYASCIWPIYLSEKFGEDIIKDIWIKCGQVAGDNVLSATSQVLADQGSSFEEAFQEFTVWNYFTSTRADTQTFYSEGNLFPYKVYIYDSQNHPSYPVVVSSAVSPPENLGSNYVAFQVPYGTTGGLKVGFSGDSLASWEVSLIGYRSGSSPWFSEIDLNTLQNGTGDVYDWNQYDKIIMIPAVTDLYNDDTFDYAYTSSIDTALDVEEQHNDNIIPLIKLLQNYPNPFNSSTVIPFTVNSSPLTENGPIPTTLKIYNILGQKIRVLVDEEKLPGIYEISWDGKDDNGIEVASGIYFYKLKADQYTEVKKMLLVK